MSRISKPTKIPTEHIDLGERLVNLLLKRTGKRYIDKEVEVVGEEESVVSVEYNINCTPKCSIDLIKDWEMYLEMEKWNVALFLRKLPIKLEPNEIDLLKIKTGPWYDLIFATRTSRTEYGNIRKTFYTLKVYNKKKVEDWDIETNLFNEKLAMTAVNCAFIEHLEFFFVDKFNIYFGYPFIFGISLREHLNKKGRLPENEALFYAAQMLMALEYLHTVHILYRNLKPDNVIVESNGYLKITNFGKAKYVTNKTYTQCFSLEYAPPESFEAFGYTNTADIWTLAVTVYEMCTGFTPFVTGNPAETIRRIKEGMYFTPFHFSRDLNYFIQEMLVVTLGLRAGTATSNRDIRGYRWFDKINWTLLMNKLLKPPFTPEIVKNPLKDYKMFVKVANDEDTEEEDPNDYFKDF